MKPRHTLYLIVFLFISQIGFGQSQALFDDRRVSSIHISISADSLSWLYSNVLNERYLKADFVFNDGQLADTVKNVGFRLRGNTSRFSQKKSFKISFNTFVSGRKYQGVKKINLNGQHNDPTMIREKLFYDIWNRCGMPQRRTTFVRLYINGNYYGLYTGLEEMDKDWLVRNFSSPGGNLYKCTYPADLQFLGLGQQTYKNIVSGSVTGGRAYDLQTNETADDYSTLVQLVAGLQNASGPQMADQLNQVVNVDGYLKALAIDVSTGNWDNYAYNKNNYYLYFNPQTQRMEFISYDTDNTFGVDWIGINWATRLATNWIHPTEARPLAKKLLEVPEFRNRYYSYLDSISNHVVHPNIIFGHIDSLQELIYDWAAEDVFRTLDYGYTMADFELGFSGTVDNHTPYGIKPFLSQRVASSISQVQPFLSVKSTVSAGQISVFPNPSFDRIALSALAKGNLQIIDVQGKVVEEFPFQQGDISISHFPSGLYYLRLISGSQVFSGRFWKE